MEAEDGEEGLGWEGEKKRVHAIRAKPEDEEYDDEKEERKTRRREAR